MKASAVTPAELLHIQVRRDSTRPLLTFYDDATGERVELSVATFDNWVAKTAGLLTDELGIEAGDRVSLLLPAHWQTLVWACACWVVGACVVTVPNNDVVVTAAGPDMLDVAASGSGEVVGLALRPLGGRFTDSLPPGVLDYAVAVPGYPDRFMPMVPVDPSEPSLEHQGTVHSQAGLTAWAEHRADHVGMAPGGRILVSTDDLVTALVDALLVPLICDGSAVVVRHEVPAGRDARVRAERITTVVDTHVTPS
jgi:uncharacterized protein (TIGR03089 family)